MKESIGKIVVMRKNFIRDFSMPHVFLDPKIWYPKIKIQGCTHANGGKVRITMTTRFHMIQSCQIGNAPKMGDPTCMNYC